ncbi:hypothetical protein [Protofrankia symbiont of Coriaria ruscifolia]|uniref:hypothetical protein n=1 Tax=Protofrankia symbiont of Coriaria ruscifolia TaxID=1306542 RepID=UPI00104174D2|nr:hypothetical protein [Protofrankia symbiont of Coriaria ruscifolia]
MTTGTAGRRRDDAGSATELAIVMIGVFGLLTLILLFGVRWLALQAADAAATRSLEIAQSVDGTTEDARAVAVTLATSSRVVTGVDVDVTGTTSSVTVAVTARTVLGDTVHRAATGPRLRYIPDDTRR